MVGLKKLWNYKTGGEVEALAFSDDGKLGVASWDGCAYILDQNGKLLNKVCTWHRMRDVSYSNGIFGFINDNEYVYLFKDTKFWKKMWTLHEHNKAIVVLPDGFIACGLRCAYFDFDGDERWDIDVNVVNGLVVHEEYVYVADYLWGEGWHRVINAKTGKIIHITRYKEHTYGISACGNYLAVSTWSHLYLYDISDPTNPKELWNVRGLYWARNVAFSPDCNHIAVSDIYHHKLKIFDLKGNLVLEKEYGTEVWGIAWWKERIAVGLRNGEVHVYEVK